MWYKRPAKRDILEIASAACQRLSGSGRCGGIAVYYSIVPGAARRKARAVLHMYDTNTHLDKMKRVILGQTPLCVLRRADSTTADDCRKSIESAIRMRMVSI